MKISPNKTLCEEEDWAHKNSQKIGKGRTQIYSIIVN